MHPWPGSHAEARASLSVTWPVGSPAASDLSDEVE
jgi:hypothetical protein